MSLSVSVRRVSVLVVRLSPTLVSRTERLYVESFWLRYFITTLWVCGCKATSDGETSLLSTYT